MKNPFYIVITAFLILNIHSITAQDEPTSSLNKTIKLIKKLIENNNYDSYGNYLSDPFLNKKASVSYDKNTGILKLYNIAAYGTWGNPNVNYVLRLKEINPDWITGYHNRLNENFSGFTIEIPDEYLEKYEKFDDDDWSSNMTMLKENGEEEYDVSNGHFKGDVGIRIAEALKNACAILYEEK